MRQTVDFSSTRFGLTTQEAPSRTGAVAEDRPFRILVLGNLHGDAKPSALSSRRAQEIDPDNFDEVLERLAPELEIAVPGAVTRLRFRSIDDFHPDSLYREISAFHDSSRDAFVKSHSAGQQPPPPANPALPAEPYRPSSGSILDDMLGVKSGAAAPTPAPARRPDPFDDVIRSIVAPHLERAPDAAAQQKAQIGKVWDSALMRSILHQPAFQQLEAAWRSLDLFIRRVTTGGEVRLSILDLERAELDTDLQEEAGESLLRRTFDSFSETYSLCVALYEFGPADCAILERLANLCARANVPFLAAARPEMVGQSTFAGLEQARNLELAPELAALRRHPNASCIGLALPRFLLRLPWGKNTSPIDAFDFTEMPETPEHDEYLWANGAMAAAIMIAAAFEQGGWEGLMSSFDPQLDRLPVHTYGPASNPDMTPCAECWMTDELAVKLIDEGFLAFASLRRRDAIRLLRLQSISDRSPRLRAAWAGA
ncbi:MAG TPA: type VI secretion system contractile sheath large subunit [Bryobacteraceae bacterium]|nr:type VI secretion system contractile sheath large subunit [Bryobacteraceae bacterium]